MDFDKIEHRAVIKFLTKENVSPKDITDRMAKIYGQDAPSYSTIKKWAALFRAGRISLDDDPRSGRPSTAITEENVRQIEKMVMGDRRLKVLQIASEVGLSCGTVEKILRDHLHLKKVSARWVPRNLSSLDRLFRVETSEELLAQLKEDKDGFLQALVTGDETWCHHWIPETKRDSMQWKHSDSPPPKKFRVEASAGKVLASVFWDAEGILLIDFITTKERITGDYYASLMWKLRDAIKEKRRGKLSHGIRLLHDNAPVHKSRVAQRAIHDCGFEQVNHPPYSPDLAPSDYYLFRDLKKHLAGKRFASDSEVISAVCGYFDSLPKEYYLRGLEMLEGRLEKCIAVEGDYVEK